MLSYEQYILQDKQKHMKTGYNIGFERQHKERDTQRRQTGSG